MASAGRDWLLRACALSALGLAVWLAGPRAYAVLAWRVEGVAEASGPRASIDRVGFHRAPEWTRGPLLLAVLADLEPRLRGEVGLLDEPAARDLAARVSASPWVRGVDLGRAFPDRLRARLRLRRPVLQVCWRQPGRVEALVDADGVCLPVVAGTDLPRTVLSGGSGGPWPAGTVHPDPRVRAAAGVAAEWRDQLVPRVPAAPALVEVDAANLRYRLLGEGRWSEVRVGLRRGDGETVYLAYDHPPGSAAPRVPIATKARVLGAILAEHPGLGGLVAGDLRFANRWRDWLVPRPSPTEPR